MGVRRFLRNVSAMFTQDVAPLETTQSSVEPSDAELNYDWFAKFMKPGTDWAAEFKDYDQMDADIPEISAALDIRANNVCQAGFGDPSKIYQVTVEPEAMKKHIEHVDEKSQVRIRLWTHMRRMNKYGDSYGESIFAAYPDGHKEYEKLKSLDPRYVRVVEEQEERQDGTKGEKVTRYKQYGTDNDFTKPIASLEPWQVLHFRASLDPDDKQGIALIRPLRRLYRQLILMEESFIIHHLTRARLRFAWLVDVTGMAANQAQKYLDWLERKNTQRRVVNSSTGKLEVVYDPKRESGDLWIPLRNGKGDIKPLTAPINAKLEHIMYFISKISSVTSVPKVYLGYEGEMKRQLMTPVDIQLARAVRRDQFSAAYALANMYSNSIRVLEGKPDMDVKTTVMFPAQGLEDDLTRAEIMKVKTEIAEKLIALRAAPKEWIVKHILDLPVDDFGDWAKTGLKEQRISGTSMDGTQLYTELMALLEDAKDLLELRDPVVSSSTRRVLDD